MCVYKRKVYIICRRIKLMAYTEVKERNGRKYYYRVLSIRDGNKVTKQRRYLGINLVKKELNKKEIGADKILDVKNKRETKEIRAIKRRIINVIKKYKITNKKKGNIRELCKGRKQEEQRYRHSCRDKG